MSNADLPSSEPAQTTGTGANPAAVEESTLSAFHSLRSLINLILLGLIILTTSLAILMVREIQIARRQTRELEVRVTDYNQNVAPKIDELRAKLETFSKLHPEFAPIFIKYFGSTNAPAGNAAPEIQFTDPPPR